jgi:membrane protein implicated in regulation of membrane protease activity
VRDRIGFWRQTLIWGVAPLNTTAGWIGLAVLVLGAVGIVVPLVFDLSPWLTAVVLLALLVAVVLEGSYRVWRATDRKRKTALAERDDARGEMERRFEAQRYALVFEGIDTHTELYPGGVFGTAQISLRLANSSGEPLRYEVEDLAVTIHGQRSADIALDPNRGGVIAPHATVRFLAPDVSNVPANWETGTLEFTVRYGHPSVPMRYQKSQSHKITAFTVVGAPEGTSQVATEVVDDPEVEELTGTLVLKSPAG